MLDQPALPKKVEKELNGYRIVVRFYGTNDTFKYMTAQVGDPKVNVKIIGKGVNVSIGTKSSPVFLNTNRGWIRELGEKIRNKYHFEPDWGLLNGLANMILREYRIY